MLVEVVTSPCCSHASPTIELVRDVVAALSPTAAVVHRTVVALADAPHMGLYGSPSVFVDGLDLEGLTAAAAALTSRAYGPNGAFRPPRWLVEAAVLRALSPSGVLFLCVANSARSQMAEAIARALSLPGVRVFSAGSAPAPAVHPFAVDVLAELGLDARRHRSKGLAEIPRDAVDTVITLCAEEVCPAWLGHARRVHWGLPDPTAATGGANARRAAFRAVRDELARRLACLFAQPSDTTEALP